ncbi:hypothetical protein FACS1894186_5840 [Alphaproteobacteria bacterium]|nr:hypothetical protein FACS1894186_5840 [Alphaproteobacteria bacterium]
MSGIDGTGRFVVIYICENETYIRAGCFDGTLAKFVARAEAECKTIYATIVPQFVAMAREKLEKESKND